MAMKNFEDCFQLDIEYAKNLKEVVEKSDCLLLLTAWKEFETNKTLLLSKTLFDFRYFLKR
jgi:UDP-glucose 6-dehydrogenase